MKKNFLFYFFLLSACLGKAQTPDIQWASHILYASSVSDIEADNSPRYKAEQALGKPNTFPSNQSPCAWAPSSQKAGKNQHLIVGYETPMRIEQIIINENRYVGAIVEINVGYVASLEKIKHVKDITRKNIYLETKPTINKTAGRFWTIPTLTPIDSVNFVEVVLIFDDTKDIPQIDAIGICKNKNNPPIGVNAFNFKDAINEDVGKAVNTSYEEIVPVISHDGNTLYFTRSKHPKNVGNPNKQDIWYAEMDKRGSFRKIKNIGAPINTAQHNSSFGCSANNTKLLLNNIYKSDSVFAKGLSYSTKVNGKWTYPKEIPVQDFYNKNNYGEYFITQDEKILLSTAQRNDSYGGKDVYVSFLQPNGSYSVPKNLGKQINTACSEAAPFLSPNGKVLFFSTAGHLGFGSNDIFLAYRLDDTWEKWSEPINLGTWINSPEWDAYMSMPMSGDYIYFSSYKISKTNADIFRVKLTEEMRKKLFGEEK